MYREVYKGEMTTAALPFRCYMPIDHVRDTSRAPRWLLSCALTLMNRDALIPTRHEEVRSSCDAGDCSRETLLHQRLFDVEIVGRISRAQDAGRCCGLIMRQMRPSPAELQQSLLQV